MKKSVVLSFLLLASSVNAINFTDYGYKLNCAVDDCRQAVLESLRFVPICVANGKTLKKDYVTYLTNKLENLQNGDLITILEGTNSSNQYTYTNNDILYASKLLNTENSYVIEDRFKEFKINTTGQFVVRNVPYAIYDRYGKLLDIAENDSYIYMNDNYTDINDSAVNFWLTSYGGFKEYSIDTPYKVFKDKFQNDKDFQEMVTFQSYGSIQELWRLFDKVNITTPRQNSKCIEVDHIKAKQDLQRQFKFEYKSKQDTKDLSVVKHLKNGEYYLYSIHAKNPKNGIDWGSYDLPYAGQELNEEAYKNLNGQNKEQIVEIHNRYVLDNNITANEIEKKIGTSISFFPDADGIEAVFDQTDGAKDIKMDVLFKSKGKYILGNNRLINGEVQEIVDTVFIFDRYKKTKYVDSIKIRASDIVNGERFAKIKANDDGKANGVKGIYQANYQLQNLDSIIYCGGIDEIHWKIDEILVDNSGRQRPIFKSVGYNGRNNSFIVANEIITGKTSYRIKDGELNTNLEGFIYGFAPQKVNTATCGNISNGGNTGDNNNTEVEQKPSDKVTTISTVWTSDTDSTCPVDDTNKALNLVYSRTSNQNVCVKVDIGSDFVGSTPKAKLIDLNIKQAVKSLDIPINGIVDFGKLSSSVYQIEVSNGTKSVKSNNFAVITTSPIAKDLSTTAGNDLKISINDLLSSNPFNSSKLQNITMNIDSYKFTRDYSKDNVYNIRFPLATSGKYQALIKVDDSRLENKNICLDKVYTNANFFENGLSTCYSKTREANISFTSDDVANASTSIQKSLNDKYVLMDNSLLDYVELNTKVSNPVIKKYNDALKLTYNLKFENNNDSYFKDRLRLGDEAIGGYSQGNVLYTDVVATKAELDKIYNDELSRLSRLTAWYSENPKPLNKTSKLKIAYLKTIKKPFSEVTSSSSGSIFIDHPELPEFYLDTKSSTVALNTGATNSIGSDKIPFIYLDILVEDKDLDFTNNVIKADEFVMYKLDKSGKTETVNDSTYKKEALKKLFENTITHYGTKFRYDEMSGNISVDLEASQKNKNNVREIAYVLKSSPFAPNKNYRIDFYKPQSYEKAKEFYDSNSTHRYGDKKKYKPENKEQYDNKSRKRD